VTATHYEIMKFGRKTAGAPKHWFMVGRERARSEKGKTKKLIILKY